MHVETYLGHRLPPGWSGPVIRSDGVVGFVCQHGVVHPCFSSVREAQDEGRALAGVHACDGCCNDSLFPGREPKAGDLAICGFGCLGLITKTKRQRLKGEKSLAWVGVHIDPMNPLKRPYFTLWHSRSPILLGRAETEALADWNRALMLGYVDKS